MQQNQNVNVAKLIAVIVIMLCFPSALHATEEEDKDGILNIVWENDIFGGTDQNYTNGMRISWLSSEAGMPDWVNWAVHNFLPVADEGHKRTSIAIGQSMFTPANLATTAPQPNDRPYAGWLYGTVGVVSDTGKTLDNVMLTVGMVGPSAYAGPVQKFVHSAIGDPEPMGWNNQLHDEPGIMFTYERKWRGLYQISPFGLGVDATPHVGVDLGNIFTDASTGLTFRLGRDLPTDYGPPRIRPSVPGSDFFIPKEDLGWYLFAGFEGRAVARNIFLDGNTFRESLHVDKEPFVGGLQAGAAVTYGATRLSYTQVFLTREFETQKRSEEFGAVTLSWRF